MKGKILIGSNLENVIQSEYRYSLLSRILPDLMLWNERLHTYPTRIFFTHYLQHCDPDPGNNVPGHKNAFVFNDAVNNLDRPGHIRVIDRFAQPKSAMRNKVKFSNLHYIRPMQEYQDA